jgi:hypothetical protein
MTIERSDKNGRELAARADPGEAEIRETSAIERGPSMWDEIDRWLARADATIDRLEEGAARFAQRAEHTYDATQRIGAKLQRLRTHDGPAAPRKRGSHE